MQCPFAHVRERATRGHLSGTGRRLKGRRIERGNSQTYSATRSRSPPWTTGLSSHEHRCQEGEGGGCRRELHGLGDTPKRTALRRRSGERYREREREDRRQSQSVSQSNSSATGRRRRDTR